MDQSLHLYDYRDLVATFQSLFTIFTTNIELVGETRT